MKKVDFKMKKEKLFAIVASICLLFFYACSQGGGKSQNTKTGNESLIDPTITLTITEVIVDIMPFSIEELKMIDESGVIVSFYIKNLDKWFENAMLNKVVIPEPEKQRFTYIPPLETQFSNVPIRKSYFKLDDNARLLFEFNVNDNNYSIGVGTGTKFVVQKSTDGKYTLLPEETAKLSPPPA